MRPPNWRSAMFAAVSGAVGLAILAGCTTRQSGLSATDQTARYLQSARGRYVIPGPPGDPWGPYIKEASNRFDIPQSWIRALMRQESGGNLYRNGRLITSSAGAMGLMQVMPGTYSELRARHNLGPDPFDPHDNIMAGVGYMREMYDMYGSPGFLAAYNAGPNRLDDYLANQRGLPDETRHYVASIGPSLRTAAPRVRSPAEQYAMNSVPLYIPPGPRFGYGGGVQVPTVQVASAASAYRAPVFTQAPVQPSYTPQPRAVAVAWAAPPQPAYTPPVQVQQPRAVAQPQPSYTPAPAQQPPALAWAETPRQVSVPVSQAMAEPAPRVVVARAEDVQDEDTNSGRRHRYWTRSRHNYNATRLALVIPRNPPVQRRGGSLHLISSAVAAEAYPVRRPAKATPTPVSYTKPEQPRAQGSHSTTWKLQASGPTQGPPACHKNKFGKTVCGPQGI